jgi:drug/metabolite transporter (DMT)-like permease
VKNGVLMVAGAAASWGTWSLFLRPSGVPPSVQSPILFLVMALVALPLSWREPKPTWDRTAVLLLVGNALTDAFNVITFFGALAYTTVSIAVLTHYFAPIWIALAAPRIEGALIPGARGAAAVALAGLVIVLEPWRAPAEGAVIGAALGMASALAYAGNVFIVRRLATRVGNARQVSYHSAIAAVLLLPFAAGNADHLTANGVALVACGSATIGALSGIVYVAGLRRIGSARAGVLAYAEPLVAVVVGAIAWGEPLRPLAAVGGALVLAAGIYVARRC